MHSPRRRPIRALISAATALAVWLSLTTAVCHSAPQPTARVVSPLASSVVAAPSIRAHDRHAGSPPAAIDREPMRAGSVTVGSTSARATNVRAHRPRRLALRYDATAPPATL